MSSFLCRLRLIELHRQVIDEINCGGYELDFAQEMNNKVITAMGEIKDHFQVSTDPQKFTRSNQVTCMERKICHVMAQGQLLQLHRPFLFRGCYDDHFVSWSIIRTQSCVLTISRLPLASNVLNLHNWSFNILVLIIREASSFVGGLLYYMVLRLWVLMTTFISCRLTYTDSYRSLCYL